MKAAIVFGGYGVFGTIVARELIRGGIEVCIAGRDRERAGTIARELGARAIDCDLTRKDSCLAALKAAGGSVVAVNCAGPFAQFGSVLLDACLEARCDYCDIADDRAFFKLARGRSAQFEARGLCAVIGCASLPAISGALAIHLMSGAKSPPERARATLFIGNRNPKGLAAVTSALASCNKPIAAPQGELRGFRDAELIPVPPPFGPRTASNLDGAEYDLFPALLGVKAVTVKCGFEMRAANWLFTLLAHMPFRWGTRMGKLMHALGKFAPPIGHSGGAIVTELFWSDGTKRVGAISGAEFGQRMAVLPCVYAARALCAGAKKRGALTAYEFLGAEETIRELQADGFEFSVDEKVGRIS